MVFTTTLLGIGNPPTFSRVLIHAVIEDAIFILFYLRQDAILGSEVEGLSIGNL